MPTRWNLTFNLFAQVYNYRDYFTAYVTDAFNIDIYENDWDTCGKNLNILRPIHSATNILSCVYNPTSHLFVSECFNIIDALSNYCSNSNLALRAAVEVIFSTWCSYYIHLPPFNLVASVFDPRYKLTGLEILLDNYYQKIKFISNALHLETVLEINVANTLALNKTTITDWCIEIVANQSTGGSSSTSTSSQVLRFQHLDASARLMMQVRNQTGTSNSELESYLITNFEFTGQFVGRGFDLMDWWK